MEFKVKQQDVNIKSLQETVAQLQNELAEKDRTIALNEALIEKNTSVIQSLNHQLHLFRTARFGRKSEKTVNDSQVEMFDEIEVDEASIDKAVEEKETITYTRVKNKTGRKPLPKHLPYVEKFHDLTDEEKQCPCGCELTHITDD